MLLWILFALGCSGASIQGSVDGESVTGGEAFFVEEEDYYINGDSRIQVFTGDVKDGCQAYAQLLDEVNDINLGDIVSGDYDDIEEWWTETFPEDWWFTTITLRVSDLSDDLSEADFYGAKARQGEPNEAGEARVQMVHFTAHQTVSGFLNGDDQRNYHSDRGVLKVSHWSETERIRGSFSTTMLDSGGDEEGEVALRFNATHCAEVQAEIDG